MLWLRMGMDINQIIELWRGLSPHLARAIHSKEPHKDEHTDEEKGDEDSEEKRADPIEGRHEENDV
jgi:hypothetical protein